MRADTLWRWGTVGVVSGLCVAFIACERGSPPADAGTRLAAPPAADGSPPLASVGAPATWMVSATRSPITGQQTVSLKTSSRNVIGDPQASFRPTLMIRCEGQELEIFVVTGLAASQEHAADGAYGVGLRFGDAPARELRIRPEFENRSLRLEPAAELLREMRENDAFEFRYTSRLAGVARMSFDLRGLRDVVSELDQACPS